jgi:acyl-CoA synthetase (AMP-forming)/AMP-acid ligase II
VKGDRVTLALGNSVDYVVAAIGVLKSGAILNPVNPALGAGSCRTCSATPILASS